MSYQNEEIDYCEVEGAVDVSVEEVHEKYRRKRLLESLMGPGLSTLFHVFLIAILAIFLVTKYKTEEKDIVVTLPPPEEKQKLEVETPEPEKQITDRIIPDPVVMKIKVNDKVTDSTSFENLPDKAPQVESDLPNETMLDIIASASQVFTPMSGSRTPGGIAGNQERFGCNPGVPPMIDASLKWLAKVQNPDGSWGDAAQSAYTGLAVLTFLAQGETNISTRYGQTVNKALKWLVDDAIDVKKHHGYPHAIKTYALCEAYAMTGISSIEEKMNKCVRILIKGQQEGGAYDYNYSTDQKRQDLSFSGWNFQALKAADIAACTEPGLQEAIYKAVDYLKKQSASSKSFAYTTANNNPENAGGAGKWTMRAVGTLCLIFLDHGVNPSLTDELDRIASEDLKKFSYNNPPGRSLYGWYYATNAMFQAQGEYWKAWKDKFQQELKDNQHKEGYWVYPGKNHIPGDDISQKVYATTLNTLQISVFHRHLPTSKLAKKNKQTKKKPVKTEEEGLTVF